jgi:hypothetical protein
VTQPQSTAVAPPVPDPRRRILDLVQATGDTLARLDAEQPQRIDAEQAAVIAEARKLVEGLKPQNLDDDGAFSRDLHAARRAVTDGFPALDRLQRRRRLADRWLMQNPGGGDAA